jgi:hypothetical protein
MRSRTVGKMFKKARERTYVGLLRVRLGRLVRGETATAGGVSDDGD